MQTYKCLSDLEQLYSHHPAYPIIKNLLHHVITSNTTAQRAYNPEEDGYIVLIERYDIDHQLEVFNPTLKLVQVQWEGVTQIDDFFHAVYLPNNQFALSFLIPNESWLPANLRQSLLVHMDD